MIQQYPESFIYIAILIGGMLALFQPYRAFLFAVFSISALDLNAAVLTRTFLGPYLNLFDVFILVMLLALAVHLLVQKRPLVLPRPVIWIFIVWIMGTILGLWELGRRYEILRASRWVLNFPIAFLVAANLVSDVDRAERLVLTVFFGALLTSIQHVVGVHGDSSNTLLLRRMGFIFSPGIYLLVATTQNQFFKKRAGYIRILFFLGVPIFAISLLLSSTRSLWISVIAAPLILAFLLGKLDGMPRIMTMGLIIVLLVMLVFPVVLPSLDPVNLVYSRYETLRDEALRYQSTRTRVAVARVETQAWLEGNWLIGRGLGFHWADEYYSVFGKEVAWGHLGYIAYLARLGLVGLFVYGIYVPLSGIRAARRLYLNSSDDTLRELASLGLACFIVNSVAHSMSGSYLQLGSVISGLLFGAVISMEAVQAKKLSISGAKFYEPVASYHRRHPIV